MTAQLTIDDLDVFEDGLIERFRDHPAMTGLADLTDDEFLEILLQRRFVSLAFTPAYDLTIDLLDDEEAIRIARIILREEYPDETGGTPSHREDMVTDLIRLGATEERIRTTVPSEATAGAISDTFRLIAAAGRDACPDTRLLTMLRFWGEVLVSVEYSLLWPRMADRLVTATGKNLSRFYYPHLVHDAKDRPLSQPSKLATTHSDRLAARLLTLLTSERERQCFQDTESELVGLKTRFYDQFRSTVGASS